jgi:hypothetical protein
MPRTAFRLRIKPGKEQEAAPATYPDHDSLCHHHLNREMRGIAAGNIALSLLYNCHLLLQTFPGVN